MYGLILYRRYVFYHILSTVKSRSVMLRVTKARDRPSGLPKNQSKSLKE